MIGLSTMLFLALLSQLVNLASALDRGSSLDHSVFLRTCVVTVCHSDSPRLLLFDVRCQCHM